MTVQDLVVVRDVDIEFEEGLTVLSGETGAGKSIIIEALGLALGARADSRLVREGSERAAVAAVFDITAAEDARALLSAHGLECDSECVLRRTVTKDGRSRAFCNASPVPVQLMRQIGSAIVDVHAQHADQRLLQHDMQRHMLDVYGDLQSQVGSVNHAYEAWKSAHDALANLEANGQQSDRVELLRYQIEELNAARIDAGDTDTIESEFKRLANGAADLERCSAVRHALKGDDDGILSALELAASRTRELVDGHAEASALLELVEQSVVTVEEALHELDRMQDSIEIDPERLQRLDERLAELHMLARKHQVALEDLPTLCSSLADELEAFEQRDAAQAKLRQEIDAAQGAYLQHAAVLSEKRVEVATTMRRDITARIRELGIPQADFDISMEDAGSDTPRLYGRDRIEFVIATNPGQTPGPLAKIASGGELSRVGLAIQAGTANHSGVPVVVYDEVDTGIGGTTANIVGQNLRDLARCCQVICITHSPQVASAGDHHLVVDKSVVDARTETTIRRLDKAEREAEIARMLGAAEATASSVAHARDLMATASQDS